MLQDAAAKEATKDGTGDEQQNEDWDHKVSEAAVGTFRGQDLAEALSGAGCGPAASLVGASLQVFVLVFIIVMEVRRRLRHQLRQVVNVHQRLAVCRLWPASWVGIGAAHVRPGRGDRLGIGMVCRVV